MTLGLGKQRFEFRVSGEPVGKGRPKFRRVGKGVSTYTPKATKVAEARVLEAWQQAGSVRLHGPVAVELVAVHERPDSHYLTDGISLSAAGRRHPLPHRTTPDLDNVLKLYQDALNKHAWKDDARIVSVTLRRLWGNASETRFEAWELTG